MIKTVKYFVIALLSLFGDLFAADARTKAVSNVEIIKYGYTAQSGVGDVPVVLLTIHGNGRYSARLGLIPEGESIAGEMDSNSRRALSAVLSKIKKMSTRYAKIGMVAPGYRTYYIECIYNGRKFYIETSHPCFRGANSEDMPKYVGNLQFENMWNMIVSDLNKLIAGCPVSE